ncbi:MAG TPA: hypothetical protein VEB69_02670 [Acidimicrobiia bacterium]|nr:hypothetical protein [Acidimicrobiia bacterium]
MDQMTNEITVQPGPSTDSTPRLFTMSMVISGIRCVLAYVILPFVTPFLGLAPGVGPVLGLVIGVVAIAANVFSLRRFWKANHRWRVPITFLHVGVIILLLVLIWFDLAELLG